MSCLSIGGHEYITPLEDRSRRQAKEGKIGNDASLIILDVPSGEPTFVPDEEDEIS